MRAGSVLHPQLERVNPHKLMYAQLYMSNTYTNFFHSKVRAYLPNNQIFATKQLLLNDKHFHR